MKKLFISRNGYGFVALTTRNSTTQNVTWVDTATGETHEDSQSSLWVMPQHHSNDAHLPAPEPFHIGWSELTSENIEKLGQSINCSEKVCYLSQDEGLKVQKVIQSLLNPIQNGIA